MKRAVAAVALLFALGTAVEVEAAAGSARRRGAKGAVKGKSRKPPPPVEEAPAEPPPEPAEAAAPAVEAPSAQSAGVASPPPQAPPAAAPTAASGSNEKPKLLVTALTPAGGVDLQLASALTESVTLEAQNRGFFDVVSSNDIQTLLGVDRQRQMLGCSEDSASCLTELAGALGARFVMSGSVAKLGDAYQLNLQTLDSSKAQPLGRSTRIAKDLVTLRAQMAYAVAEATATPLPPPPSRVVPYTVMGAGGLAVVVGSVLGMMAVSQEGAIARELKNGESSPAALKPLSAYREEVAALGTQKTVALGVVGAGAALLVVGFLLNPPDAAAPSGSVAPVAVTFTGQGVAWSGTW